MMNVERAFMDASTSVIIWMEAFSVRAMAVIYWTKTTKRVQVWYSFSHLRSAFLLNKIFLNIIWLNGTDLKVFCS